MVPTLGDTDILGVFELMYKLWRETNSGSGMQSTMDRVLSSHLVALGLNLGSRVFFWCYCISISALVYLSDVARLIIRSTLLKECNKLNINKTHPAQASGKLVLQKKK